MESFKWGLTYWLGRPSQTAKEGWIVNRRLPASLMVLLLLTSGFLSVVSFVPAPAAALTKDIDSTEDLEGSGSNMAVLDGVVVEDGTVRLATEVYPIHDTQWSDSNAEEMVVDGSNKPMLGRASHWNTLTGFDSNGDFMHSAVWDRDNSRVLLYGGVHDSGTQRFIHNEIWAYTPNGQHWEGKQHAPRFKFLHSAVWADSYHMMIVWGGITFANDQLYLLGETMCYWPANNSWGFRAPNPWGGRVGQAAVWDSDQQKMIVVGGTPDGTFVNATGDTYAYDPATNRWSQRDSLPANQARGGHTAVYDTQNDRVLIFGGIKDGNAMTSVYSYSWSSDSWTWRGNGPVDRFFHAASWDPVNNKMYVFGGQASNGANSARFFEYNPLQNDWNQLEAAPSRRHQTALVWDPDRARGLVFAGAVTTGNPPVTSYNNVLEYRIDVPFVEQGWLTGAIFDVGGALSVGNISWTPATQPSAAGPEAVKFQVASSSSLETPSNFVGPDGTPNTYFTDPAGTIVGDHHRGGGRIAYRMYFHTDDTSISPSIDSVDMEVFRYKTRGTYTSPIIDLKQPTSSLDRVRYRVEIPPDVNPNLVKVVVKIRTSDNADMTGASGWEDIDQSDTTFSIPYGRYFQFQAVITTDTWTRHLTPVFKGITVEYNTPPELFPGRVDRQSGDRSTWFTYSITYRDVDGDEPTTKLVYIDDEPYGMSSPGLDFVSGATYTYRTRLPLGTHSYYFEFSDGKNSVRDPPIGTSSGPEVLNRAPIPVIDYPADGIRVTPDEPVEFSASLSSDPDGDDIEYLWTSTVDGPMDTHSAFISRLSEGGHVITLTVTDSFGASNTTDIYILVKPYLPYLMIEDLYVDKDRPTERDRVTMTVVVENTGEADSTRAIIEFLVDDEVVDSEEDRIGMDTKQTFTFTWTATGARAFLGVRTRPAPGSEIDDEEYKTINVTANSPPEIKVALSSMKVKVGQVVTFMNNGTRDANGDRLSYLWDFGDGITSTEVSTQHSYVRAGTYYVNLTVTDTRGGESVEHFIITVKKKPKDDGPGFAFPLSLLAIAGTAAAELHRRRRRA